MTASRIRTVTVVAISAVALAGLTGCGGTELLPGHGPTSGVDRGDVAVVKGWSQALAHGDVRAAARYFAVPSLFASGDPAGPVTLRSRRQVVLANEMLSCGAVFVSAVRDGRYLNVLFRLIVRRGPGGGAAGCGSGVGQTARTAFLIRDGKIVQWLRAASRKGDPGVPAPGTGSSGEQV